MLFSRQIVLVILISCAVIKSCSGTNLTQLNIYTSSVSAANSNSIVDQTLTGNSILDLAYTTFNTSGILLAGALFLAASGYVAFQNLPPPPVVREQIRDFQSNPFGVIPANAFSTESPAVQALRTEREVVTKTVPLEIPKPQQPFVFVTQRPNIVNPFITTSQKELPISYTHIPLQPTSAPHVFSYNTHGYDPEDYKDYKDDHRSNEFTGTHSSIYGYHPGDEANSIGFDPDVIDENKFVFNDYPTIKLTTSTTTPRPSAPSTNYDLSSLFVREQAPPPPVPTYVTRNKGTDSPRTFSGHPISQVPGPPYHDSVPQNILKPPVKTRPRPKKSLNLPNKKQKLVLKIPDDKSVRGNSLMGKITKAIKGKFKKAAKKPPPPSPFQPHQQQKRLKKNIAAYSNNRRQQPHHLQAAKSEPDEIYDYYDDGSEVYDDSYDDEYYYHNGFESMRAAHSMRTRGQYIPHLERENNRLKRLKTVQLKNDKVRLSTNTDQVKSSWRLQLPFALRTKSQQKNRVYR